MNFDTCDYDGCEKKLANWQPETGAHLCDEHAEEFERLVNRGDIRGVVSFGVKTREEGLKRIRSQEGD